MPSVSLGAFQQNVTALVNEYPYALAELPGAPGVPAGVTSKSFRYCASNGAFVQPLLLVGTGFNCANTPALRRLLPMMPTCEPIVSRFQRNVFVRVLSIAVYAARFFTL